MTVVAAAAVSFFAFIAASAPRRSAEGILLSALFIALFLGIATWKILDFLQEACPQVSSQGFVPARWKIRDVRGRRTHIPWAEVGEVSVVRHRLGPWWVVFKLRDGTRRTVAIQTGIPDTFPAATVKFARDRGVSVVEEESRWTELGDVSPRPPDLPVGEVGTVSMEAGVLERRLTLDLIVAITIVGSLTIALGYWLSTVLTPAPPSERNWLFELFMVMLLYFASIGNLGIISAGLLLTAASPSVSENGLVPDRWKLIDVIRRRRLILWPEIDRVVVHWLRNDEWIMYLYLKEGGERRIWKRAGIPAKFPLVVREYARSHGVVVND